MPATSLTSHEAAIDLHRLRQVDLNLLLVLHLLLETSSVSETARRLNSSQPSISRMLERLRRELDDPLLVKSANAMMRTARGNALRPLLDGMVELLQAVYQPPADYRLSDERRVCTIGSNDSLQATFAAPLFAELKRRAPHAQLRFKPVPYPNPTRALHDGEVDLLLGMSDHEEPAFRSTVLLQSGFACMCASGNSAVGHAPSIAELAPLPYLDVSHLGYVTAATDALFAAEGLRKNTVGAMSSFLAASDVIARSDRVCLVPTYLVPTLSRYEGVRLVALAGTQGRHAIRMFWHNHPFRRLHGRSARDAGGHCKEHGCDAAIATLRLPSPRTGPHWPVTSLGRFRALT